eukprot:1190652-Pyramimonas_sp.AAC.1
MGRRGVGSCYGRCAHLVAAHSLEEVEERSPRFAEAARPRAHGPHEGDDGLSRRLVFHAPQRLALLPDLIIQQPRAATNARSVVGKHQGVGQTKAR